MKRSFNIFVLYSQVAVFDSSVTEPFNDWSPGHVDQGFAWRRPYSVLFSTLAESGTCPVDVELGEYAIYSESDNAIRVIEVPFSIRSGRVEVGSISETTTLDLDPGSYSLRYQAYATIGNSLGPIRFSFMRNPYPRFSMLRVDTGLSIRGDLLLSATAAGG
jgi:hypothetical protein